MARLRCLLVALDALLLLRTPILVSAPSFGPTSASTTGHHHRRRSTGTTYFGPASIATYHHRYTTSSHPAPPSCGPKSASAATFKHQGVPEAVKAWACLVEKTIIGGDHAVSIEDAAEGDGYSTASAYFQATLGAARAAPSKHNHEAVKAWACLVEKTIIGDKHRAVSIEDAAEGDGCSTASAYSQATLGAGRAAPSKHKGVPKAVKAWACLIDNSVIGGRRAVPMEDGAENHGHNTAYAYFQATLSAASFKHMGVPEAVKAWELLLEKSASRPLPLAATGLVSKPHMETGRNAAAAVACALGDSAVRSKTCARPQPTTETVTTTPPIIADIGAASGRAGPTTCCFDKAPATSARLTTATGGSAEEVLVSTTKAQISATTTMSTGQVQSSINRRPWAGVVLLGMVLAVAFAVVSLQLTDASSSRCSWCPSKTSEWKASCCELQFCKRCVEIGYVYTHSPDYLTDPCLRDGCLLPVGRIIYDEMDQSYYSHYQQLTLAYDQPALQPLIDEGLVEKTERVVRRGHTSSMDVHRRNFPAMKRDVYYTRRGESGLQRVLEVQLEPEEW